MLKDKINIYQQYSVLQMKCASCGSEDHIIENCPKVHLVLPRDQVIKNYLEETNSQSRSYKRADKRRFNALLDLIEIQKRAKVLIKRIGTLGTTNSESELDNHHNKRRRSSYFGLVPGDGTVNTSYSSTTNLSDIGDNMGILKVKRRVSETPERNNRAASFSLADLDERKKAIPFLPEFEKRIFHNYEESIVFDQVKNFQIYFPHNNVVKILEELEAKRKNLKTIGLNFNNVNEVNLFKIKLGRILEKSRLKKQLKVGKSSSKESLGSMLFKKKSNASELSNANSLKFKSSLELGFIPRSQSQERSASRERMGSLNKKNISFLN